MRGGKYSMVSFVKNECKMIKNANDFITIYMSSVAGAPCAICPMYESCDCQIKMEIAPMQSKQVQVVKCIDTGIHGFYGQYTGRSLGRVIHFLYDVYGCIRADSFTVGDGVVKWGKDIIATYDWIADTDVPRFTFHSGYRSYDNKQKETLFLLIGGGLTMARLDITKCNLQQAICIMAEADTGAFVNDLYTICMVSEKIDPLCFMGPFTIPMMFDDFEIYGQDLERIWSVICRRNIVLIHVLLRAQQFGFIAKKDIHHAVQYETATTPFDFKQLYEKVKERLPEFDPETRLDVASIEKLFSAVEPQSPAAAMAHWWANCLRGTGKSDAALEENPMGSMLMGLTAGLKKADSEEQIQKFEDELTRLIEVVLSDRRPVYHKNRSRFEPKSKKRRIQRKFYKKEYDKYNEKAKFGFPPKLPDHRAMITGYWRRPCSFGVDYHPDQILAEACAIAGIKCSMLTFPFKTHCRVEQDWAGVANGYCADMEIIFGKVPEKGMRRN